MRTIKCRGYCTETQSWVIGSLITYKNGETYIVEHIDEEVSFLVDPEMVGQSLERDDRQGAPIYEGDIRKITLRGGGWWGAVDVDKIGVVEWNDDTSMFVIRWGYSKNQHHCDDSEDIFYTSVLLGNIHDNPELIK